MSHYPDRWHVCYFLSDAMNAIGMRNEVIRDERTLNCWGFIFPDHNNRLMVWLIDNRLPGEQVHEDPAAIELLERGVIVAHAQQPDQKRVGGVWLPIAASPGFDGWWLGKKEYDAAIVAYIRDARRASVLADVGARFDLKLSQGVFGRDAMMVYAKARCGLNVPSQYGEPFAYDSANMRLFEIAACVIPPVTSHEEYLIDLDFIDGVTCVTYGAHRSVNDAVQIAIDNPQIGNAAKDLITLEHNYTRRAYQVKQWLSE